MVCVHPPEWMTWTLALSLDRKDCLFCERTRWYWQIHTVPASCRCVLLKVLSFSTDFYFVRQAMWQNQTNLICDRRSAFDPSSVCLDSAVRTCPWTVLGSVTLFWPSSKIGLHSSVISWLLLMCLLCSSRPPSNNWATVQLKTSRS